MSEVTRPRLIEERKRRQWSQQELAEHFDTTRNNVSRWEMGQTTPGDPIFAQNYANSLANRLRNLGCALTLLQPMNSRRLLPLSMMPRRRLLPLEISSRPSGPSPIHVTHISPDATRSLSNWISTSCQRASMSRQPHAGQH